jgi:hypothetical protein
MPDKGEPGNGFRDDAQRQQAEKESRQHQANDTGTVSLQFVRSVLPNPSGGLELIYCSVKGHFLGRIVVGSTSPGFLRIMGEDFAAFCREQTSQIIKPGQAGALPVPPS